MPNEILIIVLSPNKPLINVELEVLRACNTAISGGAYSEAGGGSGRLAGGTEGFLTTAERAEGSRSTTVIQWFQGPKGTEIRLIGAELSKVPEASKDSRRLLPLLNTACKRK